MGFIRGQMFFYDHTSFVASGWSEQHYLRAEDQPLTDALATLRLLAIARLPLLAPGISISYLRVSNDGVFRDSQIANGVAPLQAPALAPGADVIQPGQGNANPGGGGGGGGGPGNPQFDGNPPDMPWTAVYCRGEGGPPWTARALFPLAGLPDGLTWSSNVGIVADPWAANFTAFANILKQTWGFLAQDNSNNNPPKPITNVVNAAGTVTVTCPAHGFTTGNLVSIRGVLTIPKVGTQLNRTWQIVKVDDASFTLVGTGTLPVFTYAQGGTARLRKRTVVPYVKVFQRRFGSRKRGRPFGLLSGRRRAKKT